MSFQRNKPRHRSASLTIVLLLVISPIFSTISWAEGLNDPPAASPIVNETNPAVVLSQIMRLERIEVEGGAELIRSEEHTSELQSPCNLVCRLLLEKKKQ